jgi:hypothetical protein
MSQTETESQEAKAASHTKLPKVIKIRLSVLHPSPENDLIYKHDQDAIEELAEWLKESKGQLEPLFVTADNFIISGHRRYYALLMNGETFAPCIREPFRRMAKDTDDYLRLLRAHNRQREKTAEEKIREELLDIDPEAANGLYRHRRELLTQPQRNGVHQLHVEGKKRRHEISEEKTEHVKYIQKIIEERHKFWPLSDRGVHYPLLNYNFVRGHYHPKQNDHDWGGPPRVLHYKNDRQSYQATVDLLTRLRLKGFVPWEALADPTRPVTEYRPFDNVREFIKQETDNLFTGYWRSLLQSQPNHVEVLVEKNTVYHMVLQVTRKYQITTRSARGLNCIDSFHDMAETYRNSGKEFLDLIVLSDHDPEGQFIPHDAGRCLRDDFGIDKIRVFPAGVTRDQINGIYSDGVKRDPLPSDNEAKENSSHYKWYVERNGGHTTTWELEALDPRNMLADLDHVIRSVINIELFNREVEAEREEVTRLEAARRVGQEALRGLAF